MLVSICLFPICPKVPHWKELSYNLCERFAYVDIDPVSKNNPEYRHSCLNDAVIEILDEDYGAILNHFKSVTAYYANRPTPHERLTPYKPYQKCYEENKDRVISAIISLTKHIASKDHAGIKNYMSNF